MTAHYKQSKLSLTLQKTTKTANTMKKLMIISFLSLVAFSVLSQAYDNAKSEVVEAAKAHHAMIAGI